MPIPWLMVGFTTVSAALLLITPFLAASLSCSPSRKPCGAAARASFSP